MDITRTIQETRRRADEWKQEGFRIGLVPTMGYLHEGHLTLLDQIKPHCDKLIVSIFINPKQFGPGEDLERYPRDFERDQKLLQERGADLIFYPTEQEMYPDPYYTYVQVEELGNVLCGRTRPTHFRGVTTVVAKLFLITKCDVAAFGQKDYQQALIIRKMVEDLNFDLEVLVCPTIREEDGLAMSSRNAYLTPDERKRAICLYHALKKAEEMFKEGEIHAARLREEMKNVVLSVPEVHVDYLEVVDAETLEPLEKVDRRTLLAGALWLGKARLIDNIIVEP
jgi:pantoate--beta-alanine ligase